MTKVFTSLVLMDMVRKGEIAVTDPISKYLPATVKVPERNGRKITLQDLATQSSGLPFRLFTRAGQGLVVLYAGYLLIGSASFAAGDARGPTPEMPAADSF